MCALLPKSKARRSWGALLPSKSAGYSSTEPFKFIWKSVFAVIDAAKRPFGWGFSEGEARKWSAGGLPGL